MKKSWGWREIGGPVKKPFEESLRPLAAFLCEGDALRLADRIFNPSLLMKPALRVPIAGDGERADLFREGRQPQQGQHGFAKALQVGDRIRKRSWWIHGSNEVEINDVEK